MKTIRVATGTKSLKEIKKHLRGKGFWSRLGEEYEVEFSNEGIKIIFIDFS